MIPLIKGQVTRQAHVGIPAGTHEEEHARQAAMNVSARNIVTSMREISSANWPDLFERMSLVEFFNKLGDFGGYLVVDVRPRQVLLASLSLVFLFVLCSLFLTRQRCTGWRQESGRRSDWRHR